MKTKKPTTKGIQFLHQIADIADLLTRQFYEAQGLPIPIDDAERMAFWEAQRSDTPKDAAYREAIEQIVSLALEADRAERAGDTERMYACFKEISAATSHYLSEDDTQDAVPAS